MAKAFNYPVILPAINGGVVAKKQLQYLAYIIPIQLLS